MPLKNTTELDEFINFMRKELVEMILNEEIHGENMEIFLKIIGKWEKNHAI